MTEINRDAPVTGSGAIEVAAPPDVIWDVISRIDRWPTWNPDVKNARLEGELVAGSRFRWKAGPGTITSVLREVTEPTVIAWTGDSFGVHAIHVWRIEPRAGGAIVHTAESMDGLPVRLFKSTLQKTLDKALQSGLDAIKREAERRASA